MGVVVRSTHVSASKLKIVCTEPMQNDNFTFSDTYKLIALWWNIKDNASGSFYLCCIQKTTLFLSPLIERTFRTFHTNNISITDIWMMMVLYIIYRPIFFPVFSIIQLNCDDAVFHFLLAELTGLSLASSIHEVEFRDRLLATPVREAKMNDKKTGWRDNIETR